MLFESGSLKSGRLGLDGRQTVETIDMHTAGEPLRVIVKGAPLLRSRNILDARREMQEDHDAFRRSLMWEPRGHSDMYGAMLIPPERDDSLFGVLFLHNEGYSTMCGHATIALARLAFELEWIAKKDGISTFNMDAPCGQIQCFVEARKGQYVTSGFKNVPSFAVEVDQQVTLIDGTTISVDIGYGGAFYAITDVEQFGLPITPEHTRYFIDKGLEVKRLVESQSTHINHPFEPDLSFLYGTIFTGAAHNDLRHSRNVCMFADGEIDRSPTGSGISARAAVLRAKGELGDQEIEIESILGSTMRVSIANTVNYGIHHAIIPMVTGEAFITGQHTFILDPDDPMVDGFLLK